MIGFKSRRLRDPLRSVMNEAVVVRRRLPVVRVSRAPRVVVRSLEDRRLFHPAGVFKPYASITSDARRLRIPFVADRGEVPGQKSFVQRLVKRSGLLHGASTGFRNLSHRIGFNAPREVSICVRRAMRKEVMHALGKAGSPVRAPRRSYSSDIEC